MSPYFTYLLHFVLHFGQTVSSEGRFVENIGPLEMSALSVSCHGDAWRGQGFCIFEGSAEVPRDKNVPTRVLNFEFEFSFEKNEDKDK